MFQDIMLHYISFCDQNEHLPYTLFESAILIEYDLTNSFDKIILVEADMETRIERVILRNHVTREEVLERINNQSNEYKIKDLAEFIITNNDKVYNEELLLERVTKIHKQIINDNSSI